ncbi:MAG: type II toxin-antitoxin system RelE/ParE family toxin [Rhodospirillales bacterium]|nr:type II toxin-antitoxin system RelE/ParE family toxin [Rhodospirillales bacterium]
MQRIALATEIAEDHDCGVLIAGTGGCRKVRFALEGRGKSGSVRAVYLYCGNTTPTFLLALFAKNEKSNLTNAEKNQLAQVAKQICKAY